MSNNTGVAAVIYMPRFMCPDEGHMRRSMARSRAAANSANEEGNNAMQAFTRGIATAFAAAILAAVTGSSVASAATIRPTVPAVGPVGCTTGLAWVKFFSASGERCYAGTGVAVVDLPQVSLMQVVGSHEVCVQTAGPPSQINCVDGPGTLGFAPTAFIQELDISR